MPLKKGRFEHLSLEKARALLGALERPLLALALARESWDTGVVGVIHEVMDELEFGSQCDALFPTEEELESWEAFARERGGDEKAIGDFVYGPDENPWR